MALITFTSAANDLAAQYSYTLLELAVTETAPPI